MAGHQLTAGNRHVAVLGLLIATLTSEVLSSLDILGLVSRSS
jgi:hypothetical protein